MSKPIRITDEMKQKARDEFAEMLVNMKMSDGKISYSKSFKYEKATATLWLTPDAYSKTVMLVTSFSDEVAWHGTAVRHTKNEFIIEDIFVYPQEVTGSTVNTDQNGYTKWLYEFDDDAFDKIRMQGHSHVNMGVSPSGVDSGHREQILSQLDADMFYIFMIWNKRLETHTLIYDMANNILYGDNDITVKIIGDESLDAFMTDARKKVQKKSSSWGKTTAKGGKKAKSKKEKEKPEYQWDQFHGYDNCGLFDPYEL